ncbi:MAG TPA: hypothetical protein VMN60_11000 [Longimicrobiales bacterium]|nr:hypothetical protein [Longimicrobiales bacterium]
MDDETRAEFATMRAEMQAGSSRIDRYFELNQLQIAELRSELVREIHAVHSDLGGEIQGLRSELRSFRDWTEAGFARVWMELRGLRKWAEEQFAAVRADIGRLDSRVRGLEERRG